MVGLPLLKKISMFLSCETVNLLLLSPFFFLLLLSCTTDLPDASSLKLLYVVWMYMFQWK